MFLSLIASGVPIAVLQLIVYPQLAKILGGDNYGLLLTVYSIWMLAANATGGALNNIKLLRNNCYMDENIEGDYPIILKRWSLWSAVICFIVIGLYCNFEVLHCVLGAIVAILIFSSNYFEAGFRIHLNYLYIAINGLILSAGFLLGFFLFKKTGIWELVFITGYGCACVFSALKSGIAFEKKQKTKIYKETLNDSYNLAAANLLGNLTTYADKLVLFPLIGGTLLSIYYAASFLGKITGILVNPINGVILSYISRWDNSQKKFMKTVILLGFSIVLLGYFLTILIGRPVIQLLYPQWVDEVMVYLPVTTVTIMLGVFNSIISPFVLKYCKTQWQVAISLGSSFIYFASALLLWKKLGLMGFCIGTIIGALSRTIIMLLIYYKTDSSTTESTGN